MKRSRLLKTSYSLKELADHLGVNFRGDSNCLLTGVGTLQNAQAGQIAFLDNPRYRKFLNSTKASAVILAQNDAEHSSVNALITPNPYLVYAKVAALFEKQIPIIKGIHPTAIVAEDCHIDPSVSIGPYCVIDNNVTIGENVIIGAHCYIGADAIIAANTRFWPRVTVLHGTQIGQRVIIHSGAVIGSDGFGNALDRGRWYKVPQLGRVIIGDDVEIGANTTIDRGALEDTVIDEGARLDNQIQIAHNVKIGAHTAIAACVGIAGSTTIGKHCMIGGAVGISGHLEITDQVMVTGMTQVLKSISIPGIYSSGTGMLKNADWHRSVVRFKQLDELAKRVQYLEEKLKDKELL